MTWFKVDDKFHDHPKARRAGLAACGLWLRSGSWSADNLTDGFIPDDVLPRWSGRGVDVFELSDALVAVGLWERDAVGGEDGYRFRKWAKYQPTKAKVLADREAARVRMADARANIGKSSAERSAEQGAHVRTTPSRPDPSRPAPSSVTAGGSAQAVDNPGGLTDDDLDKIAQKTGGGREHAARVARDVLGRTTETVRKPLAYVLRAVVAEPEQHRHRGPRTRDTECPAHEGQPATNCGGCRSDAIAAR